MATESHVSMVRGLGNSCSQPLFAKRPSQMVWSGRKTISRPCCCGGGRVRANSRFERNLFWRKGRVGDYAVAQRLFPKRIESVHAGALRLPIVMHEIVTRFCGLAVEHGKKIDFGLSAVKRSDKRLDHRGCAVISPRVAPGFQFMRLRNVPVA